MFKDLVVRNRLTDKGSHRKPHMLWAAPAENTAGSSKLQPLAAKRSRGVLGHDSSLKKGDGNKVQQREVRVKRDLSPKHLARLKSELDRVIDPDCLTYK